MRYHYKKPGDWLWTPYTTESLAADAESGRVGTDWRFRPEGGSTDYTLVEALQSENPQPRPAPNPAAVGGGPEGTNQPKPKRGGFQVLSIYVIFTFLWRALTTAHEFPSRNLQVFAIALDLLCLIGLIAGGIQLYGNKSPGQPDRLGEKALLFVSVLAGLGLFAIRLHGDASWWTGHLMYEIGPR